MTRSLLLAALFAFAACVPGDAALYIVRHAEKKHPKKDDSLLSRKGKKRAEALSRALRSVDLKAIFVTEYERTRQTAAPVAKAKGLTPTRIVSDDLAGLVAALKMRPHEEDVLVVGHSDTIPDLLKELGVTPAVVIAPDDFDNLFIVDMRDPDPPELHRLHY